MFALRGKLTSKEAKLHGLHIATMGQGPDKHVLHAAQLAFCMLPSSVATCEQLYDACARALVDSQASLVAAQRQDAAGTSAAQQAWPASCRGMLLMRQT